MNELLVQMDRKENGPEEATIDELAGFIRKRYYNGTLKSIVSSSYHI